MSAPKPQNTAEWIAATQRTQEALALRPRAMGPMRYGVVGPTWTFGQPFVTMSDDSSIVTAGAWPAGYSPANGDLVMVLPWKPANGQVYIEKIVLASAPTLLQQIPLDFRNGWSNYDSNWQPGGVTKTSDGIVLLSGLIKPGTNLSVLTTVAQLPVGFRPDYDLVFDTNNTDTWRSLVVKATGEIQMVTNNGASTFFINLDGIAFPAAGAADWQTDGLAFQNGFTQLLTDSSGLNYPPVRHWKDDANGLVWWQGMVLHPAGVTADNTAMLTFPPALAAEAREHHFVSETDNAWGAVGINALNSYSSLNWKVGNQTSATQMSLNRVIYPQASQMAGFVYPALGSGWAQYGAAFTTPGYKPLPNKLVYVQGFIASGAVGTQSKIWTQPVGTRPSYAGSGQGSSGAMFNRPSNGATRARILGDQNGAWSIEQGSSAWVSLDGIIYAPRS